MKIGIYVGDYPSNNFGFEEMENGYSGSETWALEVARVMAKRGNNVVVFGATNNQKFEEGVDIRPNNSYLTSLVSNEYFDYFIFSRKQKPITELINCRHIFVMFHDGFGYRDVGAEHDYNKDKFIEGYGYLSEFQKDSLVNKLHLDPNKLHKVTNGFSEKYYHTNFRKRNSCVWSTCKTRGLRETYELVFKRIKEQVPDFEVYVTYPHDYGTDTSDFPNWIHQYSGISKKELAELQLQAKIWINPGLCTETFCITAVENAYAGNVIISPLHSGLADTLLGYPGPLLNDIQSELGTNSVVLPPLPILNQDSADMYVYHAVRSLTDDNYRNYYIPRGISIAEQYSWERAADEWLAIFRESLAKSRADIINIELT